MSFISDLKKLFNVLSDFPFNGSLVVFRALSAEIVGHDARIAPSSSRKNHPEIRPN